MIQVQTLDKGLRCFGVAPFLLRENMPFADENDPKLPDNIKALPAADRRQWITVWNSTFAGCQDEGGEADSCEQAAFRKANEALFDGNDKAAAENDILLEQSDLSTEDVVTEAPSTACATEDNETVKSEEPSPDASVSPPEDTVAQDVEPPAEATALIHKLSPARGV